MGILFYIIIIAIPVLLLVSGGLSLAGVKQADKSKQKKGNPHAFIKMNRMRVGTGNNGHTMDEREIYPMSCSDLGCS